MPTAIIPTDNGDFTSRKCGDIRVTNDEPVAGSIFIEQSDVPQAEKDKPDVIYLTVSQVPELIRILTSHMDSGASKSLENRDLSTRGITAHIGSDYKHVKTGGIYRVLHIAIKEDDLSHLVVYQDVNQMIWVRPRSQFEDGRFELHA